MHTHMRRDQKKNKLFMDQFSILLANKIDSYNYTSYEELFQYSLYSKDRDLKAI